MAGPGKIGGRHVREETEGRAESLRQVHEAREEHPPEDAQAREELQEDRPLARQVAVHGC